MKTLATYLDEESKYPQDCCMDKREALNAVKKWLLQKRQKLEEERLVKTEVFTLINPRIQHQAEYIDQLIEELK